MNQRRLTKATLWTTALFPLFLASCVDDSYDLTKDIDMTITVGGNLGIPGSYTEEFTLADIMDLEYHENPEDSVIRTDANGDYRLLKASTADPTSVDIDPVTVNAPQVTPDQTTISFNTPTNIPGEVKAAVENVTMDFTFSKNDVTDQITSISSADVDFTAILTLDFSQQSQNVNEITLTEDFTIELAMQDQTAADNMDISIPDDQSANFQIQPDAPQKIVFIRDQTIRRGEQLEVPIHFTRVHDFPVGQGLFETGNFLMQINVVANGTATTQGVPEGNISVELNTGAEVPSICLQQVTGKVNPDIDIQIDPVTVNDIPDFLNDKENQLDVKNPFIKLTVTNGTPVDVNLTADLIRQKEGMEDITIPIGSNDEEDQKIVLYAGSENNPTTNIYYLSREPMPEVVNENEHIYNNVLGDKIYDLIKTIPDEILLENIEAKALDREYTIALGEDGAHYDVETAYEINAPLTFGEDLQIVYKDSINDWSSDLEDLSIRQAVVEMDAYNGIPLNFTIDAKALDKEGNVYPNVSVVAEQGNIKPGLKYKGGDDSQRTESHIVLRITCESGNMENLDGLAISLRANTQEMESHPEWKDAVLNEGMTLQLNNIRIRIENGVTVDLN